MNGSLNCPRLYGDGIHDDTEAIQALIDGAGGELLLPKPEKFYLISKTLRLPSHFRLELTDDTVVRLADGSDCLMLMNGIPRDEKPRMGEFSFFSTYLDVYADDVPSSDITLAGGIWDANNMGQSPNPLVTGDYSNKDFNGHAILFYNVSSLTVSGVTVKDPLNFGITLDRVTDFTVENITFDYNLGNPETVCMDGVHLCGNCHRGVIRNLRGAVYDDMVALNADEGTSGTISDIEVDGLYAEDSHSAVRLLSCRESVRNVSIRNIAGTFYQYCIGFTKNYDAETAGMIENVTIENVTASKAVRRYYPHPDSYVYPLIFIEAEMCLKDITVRNMVRREYINPIDTFFIGNSSTVDGLTLENIRTENYTGKQMTFFLQYGSVDRLTMKNVVTVSDI